MSLSLIQGYSSAEDEEEAKENDEQLHFQNSSDDDGDATANRSIGYNSLFDIPKPSSASGLPSAFDVFSQVKFLFILFLFN